MILLMKEMQETQVQSLGREETLEEEVATHSNILAWEIAWTEEPGGLQSMASQTVGYSLATKHSNNTMILQIFRNTVPLLGETAVAHSYKL